MKLTVETKNDWVGSGHIGLGERERRQLGVQLNDFVLVNGRTEALPFVVALPLSLSDQEGGNGTIWVDELTQEDLCVSAGDRVSVSPIDPAQAEHISVFTPIFSRFSKRSRDQLREALKGRTIHPSQPTVQVGTNRTKTTPYRVSEVYPSEIVMIVEETRITFESRRSYFQLLIVGALLDILLNGLILLSNTPRTLFAVLEEIPLFSSVSLLTAFQQELAALSYVLSWVLLGTLTVELMPYVLQSRRDLQTSRPVVVGLAISATLFGAFLEFNIGRGTNFSTAASWLQHVPFVVIVLCVVGTFTIARGARLSAQWREDIYFRSAQSLGALLKSFTIAYCVFLLRYASFDHFPASKSSKTAPTTISWENIRQFLDQSRERVQDGPNNDPIDSDPGTEGVLIEFAQWTATVASVGLLLAGIALFWPLPDILIVAAWLALVPQRRLKTWWTPAWRHDSSPPTADLGERVIPSVTACWRNPDYLVVPLFIAAGLYVLTLLTRTTLTQLLAETSGFRLELLIVTATVFGAIGLSLLFWIRIVDAIADKMSGDAIPATFTIWTMMGSGIFAGIALTGIQNLSPKAVVGFVFCVLGVAAGVIVLTRVLSVTRINWYYTIPVGLLLTIAVLDSLPVIATSVEPSESWRTAVTTSAQTLTGELVDGTLIVLPLYFAPRAARSGRNREWRGIAGWAAGTAIIYLVTTLASLLRLVVGDATVITLLAFLLAPLLLAALVRTGMVLFQWIFHVAALGMIASPLLWFLLPASSVFLQLVIIITIVSTLIIIVLMVI
ncbi:hypothetical protein [Halorubrum halophilum]|uniref:hypothetical protein n=1 Tax=Halorubrum halophilum TaxID=413816 RepID=UPI00186B2891|nr:hypothetical protein [Halorubrum halophilum]